MNCPNCGNTKATYDVSHSKRSHADRLSRKASEARTDFHATCKKCGWKGEIGKPNVTQLLTTPFNTIPEDKEESE